MQSTVQGKIKARDLTSPWEFKQPLKISEISLDAQKNRVSVALASFTWGGERFVLSGDVNFFKERVKLDLNLTTGNIDLEDLEKVLGKRKKGAEKRPDLSVEGNIRLKSESLKFRQYKWAPFLADISFGDGGAEVEIKKAGLCGMDMPGVVKVNDQEMSLDVRPVFRSRELGPMVKCLLDQEVRATGDFDFRGRIFAKGKPEDLINTLRGDVELQAKDGRIYYWIGLDRVLELLNVTEVYKGKLPNVKKEGLAYELATMKGSFQNGKLIIKEATLDGPTLEMAGQGEIDLAEGKVNLTVLVAPLKTVDRIIKLTPLVNHILAGTLVTVPVRVGGDLKDPKVTLLSPSAVGSEVLEIMKRTIGLPFKVIEPRMSRKKEKSGEGR
jgi:hypothetical protein